MSFLSRDFAWLLALSVLSQLLLRSRRQQNLALLLASAVFYTWIHPWFAGPLLISALTDYVAARAIAQRPEAAGRWIALSAAVNLGQLGLFKYHGFFVPELAALLGGPAQAAALTPLLSLVIPAGISFYTFQTLGYTVEVARGEARARTDLVDYLLYVAFFPQLVAGPIERPERLLPQLERPRTLSAPALASGISLLLWGAVQKVVVADTLSLEVDAVFTAPEPGRALLLAGTVGFGLQLFADFSGYTDMARGAARMLGIHLSPNFDRPFLAITTPGFWRRWHLSLSRWVGAMVYRPLVERPGQAGPGRLAAALMVSFFVVGLWHGADATFAVLGLWQGAWAVIYTLGWPRIAARVRRAPAFRAAAWLFHTGVVLLPSALLFRETGLDRVGAHLARLPLPSPAEEPRLAAAFLAASALGAVVLLLGSAVARELRPAIDRGPWWPTAHAAWWCAAWALVLALGSPLGRAFVYFQF